MEMNKNKYFFVRSGPIYYGGHTGTSGINGFGWPSRAYTNAYLQYGFNFLFNATDVSPSNYNARYWGFPLRCLVR